MNYFVKFSKSKTLKVFVFDFELFPFSPKCLGILLTICHNNQHIDCEFVDIIGRNKKTRQPFVSNATFKLTAAARYSPVAASELVLVTAPGPSRGSSAL